MIDYKRAFYIACDLLNGDVLYGIDTGKIFTESMDKDGCCSSSSYRNYILTHMDKLDKGQYKEAISDNSVIEDIKAEIEKAKWIDKDTRLVRNCNASGLDVALDIIDKHIESEDNNATR